MSRALNEAREVGRNCAAAEQLYEELMKHPPKRRLTLVRNSRRFQIPELCQLLIDKGFDQRFTEVQLGVELTELAIAVGQQLNDETYGPAETSDLVGRAWAYHGNALRVASDLRLADQALQEAKRCFAEGVGGDLDKALVCRFSGLLLRARRDFEEAHSLQDHAIKLYLRHGETRLAARVMGDQALGVVYAGEPDRAIPCFERALELYVELGDEREVASARHNLAFCLTETGQHEKALAQVAEIRPLLEGTGDYLSLTRLRWLEGKILFALDRDWQAEKALVEAREAFIEAAIGYDAALVCLDLAAVYARRARTAEMRDLAEKMVPIFQSRDVHREAIAALIVFHEAALAETASLALVERISQYLRVAQHDPKLRFELA
jgi:tetratricopeptide (TPR) repeat protein